MKTYKPLPKNPLVQRMEDMQIPGSRKLPTKKLKGLYRVTYGDVYATFPITKTGKKMNKIIYTALDKKTLGKLGREAELSLDKLEKSYQKAIKESIYGTWKLGKCFIHPTRPAVVVSGRGEANFCQECLNESFVKDKIPHTREYLRPISDPHHRRHVFMVLVLIAALLFAVVVL